MYSIVRTEISANMKSNFTIIFEKNGKPDPKPKRGKSLSLGNLSDF